MVDDRILRSLDKIQPHGRTAFHQVQNLIIELVYNYVRQGIDFEVEIKSRRVGTTTSVVVVSVCRRAVYQCTFTDEQMAADDARRRRIREADQRRRAAQRIGRT